MRRIVYCGILYLSMILFSCSNSFVPSVDEVLETIPEAEITSGRDENPQLVYDESNNIVMLNFNDELNIEIKSYDEERESIVKCVDPGSIIFFNNKTSRSRYNSGGLRPMAVVVGIREDLEPGIWLVYKNGTVASPVNEETGFASSRLAHYRGNEKYLDSNGKRGILGWRYIPTAISDNGMMIGGYAIHEEGFRAHFFKIEKGAQVAVYWKLKETSDGRYIITRAKVIGTLPDGEYKKNRFYNGLKNLIAKLKLLFLPYLDNYLVSVDSIIFDESKSIYYAEGPDKDGLESIAELDFNEIYSIKSKNNSNQPPEAAFYDFDYLISDSGSPEVDGEYTYSGNYYYAPSYSNGSYFLFLFYDSGFYWGIDNIRDNNLTSRLYYTSWNYLYRPPETIAGDPDSFWSLGTGIDPSPSITAVSPISGNTDEAGNSVRGNYIYSDPDGDSEGESSFRWLRCENTTDTGTEIPGATSRHYDLQSSDEGYYLRFEVTPVDDKGYTGTPLLSEPVYIGY